MSSYFFGGFSAYRIEPSGAPAEPVRMLRQPGMIGRALDREIERDLQSVVLRRRHQRAEVGAACRARGWIASWPPSRTADRIRAARIVRFGAQRIVAALAVGRADRMDRRKVQHVETHGADRRQTRDHIVERAMLRRIVGGANAETSRTSLRTLPAGRSTSIGISGACRQANGRSSAARIASRVASESSVATCCGADLQTSADLRCATGRHAPDPARAPRPSPACVGLPRPRV